MTGRGAESVDIVLCIDATGSMGRLVSNFAYEADDLFLTLEERGAEMGRRIADFRLRIVFFKDFSVDEDPITESEFFSLPDDTEELRSFLRSMRCAGGGDYPECALEALAVALRAEVDRSGERAFIVSLLTDADAHLLGREYPRGDYPEYMPRSFEELRAIWQEGAAFSDGYLPPATPSLVGYMPKGEARELLSSLERTRLLDTYPGASLDGVSARDIAGLWADELFGRGSDVG